MGTEARYLWGKTKMDKVSVQYIDFRGQSSSPTFKNGRMYMDTDYNLKVGNDGSTFMTVTTT